MNKTSERSLAVKRAVFQLCVTVIAGCAGWSNADDLKSSSLSAAQLTAAAEATYAAYMKAPEAAAEEPGVEIPAAFWTDGIRQLMPLRVYTHLVNIVVVQHVTDGIEKGKYIYIPISSYLPMSGDDGFVFSPNPWKADRYTLGSGIFDFERKRSKQRIGQPGGPANRSQSNRAETNSMSGAAGSRR